MDWVNMLKHYQEYDDIKDEELLDEAITTLEDFFPLMDKSKLMHHSRTLVISYLALKKVKAEQINKEGE